MTFTPVCDKEAAGSDSLAIVEHGSISASTSSSSKSGLVPMMTARESSRTKDSAAAESLAASKLKLLKMYKR